MGVVLKSLIDAIIVPAKVSDLSDADDYVTTSATGGLSFTVTDTVPTVDDRSVITFVLEE